MDRIAVVTFGILLVFAMSGVVSGTAIDDSGVLSLSDHNNITSAQPISDGTQDIDIPGDESVYYEIELDAKEQVNFTTQGADQPVRLTLTGPDQVTELRTKSGDGGLGGERDATLVDTANQNGTFYLEISTTNDSPTNASLLVSSPNLTDRLERNDDIESAAPVSEERITDLELAGSELDYYAVSLNASEQVTFATENASEALRVTLFGPDQVTELRSASGGNSIGEDRDASVTYTADQNATFYVEVDSVNDRSTGYSITLRTPNLTDRFEPNDEFGTETPLSDGQTSDLFLAGAELDYYAVTLNASEQVTFGTEGAEQALRVRLFGPNQVDVLRSASGGNRVTDERDASVTYTANQNATFYVEVDSVNDRSTGYSITLRTPNLTDRLEPNNRITGAAELSDGRTEDLQIAGEESDYYAVTLNASEQVTFGTEGAERFRPVRVRMFAPDQTTVLRNASGTSRVTDDADASVTYTANRRGTFYFEVRTKNDRSTGYSAVVQTPNLTDRFEPNDEFASARFTDIGRYQNLFVAGNESDYYRVRLNASQELTARLEGENQNLVVRLYDASGRAITSGAFDSGGIFGGDTPPEFTYTAETAGTYYVEAESTNNRSSEYTLVVNSNRSITETDVAPIADAGDDVTVNRSASVTLDASGSTDPNGASLTYNWTQTDGPSVDLSGSGATRTFTAPNSSATLTFEVTVSDGNLTASDTVTVTVGRDSTGDTFSPSDYDTNGDGNVAGDLNGALQAIADYNGGEIGLQQVLQVIGGYNG